jgi:prepilin-type processing-associated H-X9-DG protein/prepilin-type N-terminal cleavage/methylation domain-containing protein
MKDALPSRSSAFTLLELLLVMLLIGVLAALLLPVIEKARQRAKQVACASQLKQIGIGVTIFLHEHDDLLPVNVPIAEGGAKEFFFDPTGKLVSSAWDANYRFFQTLSNTLVSPKLLICPADKEHIAADTFEKMSRTNLSYWTVACRPTPPYFDLLTGDGFWDDLMNMLLRAGYSKFHLRAYHGGTRGNMLFLDGHVEQMGQESLTVAFRKIQERSGLVLPPADPTQPPSSAEPSLAGTGGPGPNGNAGSAMAGSPGPNGNAGAGANPSLTTSSFDRLEQFFQSSPTAKPSAKTAVAPRSLPPQDVISAPASRLEEAVPPATSNLAAATHSTRSNAATPKEVQPSAMTDHGVLATSGRPYLWWLLLLGALVALISLKLLRRRARREEVSESGST